MKKISFIIGILIFVVAYGAYLSTTEANLDNFTTIMEYQIGGADNEIRSEVLNKKFNVIKLKLEELAANSGSGDLIVDYNLCPTYSVTVGPNGESIMDPAEYDNVLWRDSECARKGCLVDSFAEACVASMQHCAATRPSGFGGYFFQGNVNENECLPITQTNPEPIEVPCSTYTSEQSCIFMKSKAGGGFCRWGADDVCYDVYSVTEAPLYCAAITDEATCNGNSFQGTLEICWWDNGTCVY